ncbi:MAG: hypothetical protein ABSF98_01530 [Bryobacteraceae bacterium]
MFTAINRDFYEAVLDARTYAMTLLSPENADPNSKAFLSRFPIFILEDLGEEVREDPRVTSLRERLAAAAFADEFRLRTQEAINIFCSDPGDDTLRGRFFRMVDDFLNYATPRSAGLPGEAALFDDLYAQFEQDLFTDKYTLTVVASLDNFSDNGGRFRGPIARLRFAWADLFPNASLNSAYPRTRAIRYLELKNTPIFGGGGIKDRHSYFLLEFQELRVKQRGELAEAYKRAEEVTRKVVLTARLLTLAPVYAQCIGLRVLSHYSGGGRGMVLWNPRDEWIDEHSGVDLQSCDGGFQNLLPHVLKAPAASIEVLFLKIDDAFRRRRKTSRPFGDGEARENIDRLLDYCQALEAILPFRKKQILSCASKLLQFNMSSHGTATTDDAEFLKDMYDLRNLAMHGRFDQVLEDRADTHYKLRDVERFRRCVHALAVLYFLNPDRDGNPNLKRFLRELERGDAVRLTTLPGPQP